MAVTTMKEYIKAEMTVADIIEKYPETRDVFVGWGFEKFADDEMLAKVGKFMKLSSALKTKNYDEETYIKLLEDVVRDRRESVDITLKDTKKEAADIEIKGLLPCPVKLPLMEGLQGVIDEYSDKTGKTVSTVLEAASGGLKWLEDNIDGVTSPDGLPEILISAGFDRFFDRKGIFGMKESFVDVTPKEINKDFAGQGFEDPNGNFSMQAVVPAVFAVNTNELGDRKMPETWEDIMAPEFEGCVSLPVGDFDLFNSILIHIYKDYGMEGVEKLSKSLLESMHPAQMVKSGKKAGDSNPVVTIMPYFFTKMLHMNPVMKAVWPKDGAIVSPIFSLVKKDTAEKASEIASFITGKEVGDILAVRGLFPSLHPDVENVLPEGATFRWVGWDYINENDIAGIIDETLERFNSIKA